ncbi:MAG TPA: hypothetical protein VFQ36_09530 [Ktedonobacteraceae bacterium]|nr:hypothetical protein [Ktedonobacteraceae bacterium]
MFDDRRQTGQQGDTTSFSWWSWRPGIKPGRALFLGIPLVFVAFFFVLAGIYSLFSIIIDSNAPPTRIAGVVTGYTTSILDNQPHVSIRLQRNGRSSIITPAITSAEQRAIHVGDEVTLDYSPHLVYLYALEDHGQRYNLPGGSPLSNLITSISLIPLGLLFLIYPLFLTVWGWRDLRQPEMTLRGKIVGLRDSLRARMGQPRRATHPGLTPRIGRAWYGVALATPDTDAQQEVTTFAIREAQYKELREGQIVQITYSPHLHHVSSIQAAENDVPALNTEQEQAR